MLPATLVVGAAALLSSAAPAGAASFAADPASLGPVLDNGGPPADCSFPGTPRDVTFTVGGLQGPVTDAAASFTAQHTDVGDLIV